MKKQYRIFGLLCCLIYFTSYISRINLSAVLAEIITSEGIAKSSISIVLLMNFISYGTGQIISGILGDKFSPVNLIFSGLLISCVCNSLIPVCTGVGTMAAVWFVNGFAQALMWPPLVKLMSTYLDDASFSQTSANVSASSSVGTIFIYLTAPLFIRTGGWRSIFLFSAVSAALVALVWKLYFPKLIAVFPTVSSKQTAQENSKGTMSVGDIFKKYSLLFICLAIVAQGLLRDGITTWMPICLTEVYNMEAASSILLSVILPLFSIFSFQLAGFVQRKWVKNEVSLAAYMYIICGILIALWAIFYSSSLVLAVLLPAFTIALIHGINLMLIAIVPRRFSACGHVSFISGLLNSCTYIGSALSTYGMAKLSEVFGWQTTIWTLGGVAVFGLLMCGVCIRKFSFKKNS